MCTVAMYATAQMPHGKVDEVHKFPISCSRSIAALHLNPAQPLKLWNCLQYTNSTNNTAIGTVLAL